MKSPRASPPPLPLTVPAPLTPSSEKDHLQNLSPIDPQFVLSSVELPCDTLAIGTWRRIRSDSDDLRLFVLPATTTHPARLRYLLREGSTYFRLDVPIAALTAVVVSALPASGSPDTYNCDMAGSLELRIQPSRHVHAAFTFSVCTDTANIQNEEDGWAMCGDFTEEEQASRVLLHAVTVHALDRLQTALSDAVRMNELFARLLRVERAGLLADNDDMNDSNISAATEAQGVVDPDQLQLCGSVHDNFIASGSAKRRKSLVARRPMAPEMSTFAGKWSMQRSVSTPSPRVRKMSAPTPIQTGRVRKKSGGIPAGYQHQFHIADPLDAPIKGQCGSMTYHGQRRASLPTTTSGGLARATAGVYSRQGQTQPLRWKPPTSLSPLPASPTIAKAQDIAMLQMMEQSPQSAASSPPFPGLSSVSWSSASSMTSEEEMMPLSELISMDALATDTSLNNDGAAAHGQHGAGSPLNAPFSKAGYAFPTYISALLTPNKDTMLSTMPFEHAGLGYSSAWNTDPLLLQNSPSADFDVCELFSF